MGKERKKCDLCSRIQNNSTMETEQKITLHKVQGIDVKMYTRYPEVEKRLLNGKVLLDSEDNSLLFSQNPRRGPLSKEVTRGAHSRLVRRPDGNYTLSFRGVDIRETNLKEAMLAEVRHACDEMKKDRARQEAIRKAEEEKK